MTNATEAASALAASIGVPEGAVRFALPLLLVAGGYALGAALQHLGARVLPRLTAKSRTKLDDVLVHAAQGPFRLLATLAGGAAAVLVTPAPPAIHAWAWRALVVLFALAVVIFSARFVSGFVATYGSRARIGGSAPLALRRVLVAAIWIVGALFVLDNQGVSITPLLTTLGLAGLAVALAFQDTLSNFFAGLYVQADRPLDVGHYVRLEDLNVEGTVEEVGWRTTKIRTLPNNIVVVPNARVASSVVTDFDLPEPRMSLLVRVPVSGDADPRLVERALLEEATKLAETLPGLLREPAPFVRFIPGFTENGMEFTLICQVSKFTDQYLAQHELRFRIAERFRAEGVAFQRPVRIVAAKDGSLPPLLRTPEIRADRS